MAYQIVVRTERDREHAVIHGVFTSHADAVRGITPAIIQDAIENDLDLDIDDEVVMTKFHEYMIAKIHKKFQLDYQIPSSTFIDDYFSVDDGYSEYIFTRVPVT